MEDQLAAISVAPDFDVDFVRRPRVNPAPAELVDILEDAGFVVKHVLASEHTKDMVTRSGSVKQSSSIQPVARRTNSG